MNSKAAQPLSLGEVFRLIVGCLIVLGALMLFSAESPKDKGQTNTAPDAVLKQQSTPIME